MNETDRTETVRVDVGEDRVAVLTFDDPDLAVNTMRSAHVESMERALTRLETEREGLAGVVLTSAKPTFFAGGDLNELLAVEESERETFAAGVRRIKAQLRRLETLGVPVVAAIAGAALGGGLEIALAAHRRIAVADQRVQLGFPEVTLGLLPGAGGTVRSTRMLGIVPALTGLLLEGDRIEPARAFELGLVDELVDDAEDLLPRARDWIASEPEPVQPWDREGFRVPGGTPADPALTALLPALPANLSKRLRGANFPAPHAILAAVVEGAQVDFETAIEIEGRYFVSLVTGQVAKNMIGAFFDAQEVKGDRGLGDGEPFAPAKAVVLGAGMMGAGIAYACAKSGLDVVLEDVDLAAAERGKAYSERLLAKAEEGEALLARIHPTADPADAEGAELMIEAVFEDPKLKAEAYAEIEPLMAPGSLLASNTSTLPISGLAEGVGRPEDFVGLHFFSPVDKMPLLEIVVGEKTSPANVKRALDVARLLGKTPIVVNDSRGFFTSRVIAPFMDEGMAMLGEGIPAATIEQASQQAGYPAAVLRLSDELNLNLIRRIREENRAAAGESWRPHPADPVVDRMLDELGRGGRLAGAGFYEYEDGRRKRLWPGLAEAFGSRSDDLPPLRDLEERMLFAEALTAAKTYEEGVIESRADANVGSLLGIGFPRWTGGVLRYIDQYEGGRAGFVARAEELAAVHGERFSPPASLREATQGPASPS
jgi:3-hydroxyacyl-CoA dehydrogenase / enoyl-CoA hydratase / 3-hydroxybutyryl-CoA epimerase